MNDLLQVMAIITEKNASENIAGMWATVITGFVMVFMILAVLILALFILGKICTFADKKAKAKQAAKKAEVAPAPAPVPVVTAEPEEEEYEVDDAEIIAVISAAIAAYSEQDGVNYVIKKIKPADRRTRSGWGNAGIMDNTRPF